MERITYRKTLDVHKNGVQFMLQGFETADNMSRVVEISLMASGDAIDFPLERIVAMMYVTSPGATEPSINECIIEDNKVVYEVLPLTVEGITTMQLKLIETSPEGATSVLASPKFSIEVTRSNVDDNGSELKTTFTAIEDFVAKAEASYSSRLINIELTSDCIFKANYADGTYYETDILQKLFLNGNVELSKSYAMGGTGVRAGEDTDNSKYYSNLAKSEAINAQNIMNDSEEILEEVKLHGIYTAFSVDFETGKVEYVSPSYKFKINTETGNLDAEGQTYTFEEEIERLVVEWLEAKGVRLSEIGKIATEHSRKINANTEEIEALKIRVTPIENGGTGASTKEDAIINLGLDKYQIPWNVNENVGKIVSEPLAAECTAKGFNTQNVTSKEFKFINSGVVKIAFKYRLSYSQSGGYDINNTWLKLYLNDNVIKTMDATSDDTNKTIDTSFNLNVQKGDVFKIELSAHCKGSGSADTADVSLSNFLIYANIETPYRYTSLTEELDTVTTTEVLNALLGV